MLKMKLLIILSLVSITLTRICYENDDCMIHPWSPNCNEYTIPDNVLTANITQMCTAYPKMYMAGCTIRLICSDAVKNAMYPDYCKPFALYKVLCQEMAGMDECLGWRAMCSVSNSTVKQCAQTSLPLAKGIIYKTYVKWICGNMSMTGCEKCDATCNIDALQIYSDLCNQMPTMEVCNYNWTQLCMYYIPKWPLCPGGTDVGPAMRMYFHGGVKDYILFYQWVPQNVPQYTIAIILILLFSILYEFLKLLRARIDKAHRQKLGEQDKGLINKTVKVTHDKMYVLMTSAVYLVEVTLGFLLMLITMTFNVGLFLAVIFGRFIGVFISGILQDYSNPGEIAEENCH